MEKFIDFIKKNIWTVAVALFFYIAFLAFTFSGNRLCDCQPTEKYQSAQNGRNSVNHFYHK